MSMREFAARARVGNIGLRDLERARENQVGKRLQKKCRVYECTFIFKT